MSNAINLDMSLFDEDADVSLPADTAPSISSAAMLVELSISCWAGRKRDAKASKDVTSRAGASDASAAVTKKLMTDCAELDAILKFAGNQRTVHYTRTLPWSNTGLRLLATSAYFDYHQDMTGAQSQFYQLRDDFIDSYQWEISKAQVKLGSLFNPDDYPTAESLRSKFAFRINYMPLPESGDFRVDVGNKQREVLQAEYKKFYGTMVENAMGELWKRSFDALSRMSERLDYSSKGDKKVFRDSLVDNVLEIVDLLDSYNVTGDATMTRMQRDLAKAMQGVSPDDLRKDHGLRAATKRQIDEAIAAIPSLDW